MALTQGEIRLSLQVVITCLFFFILTPFVTSILYTLILSRYGAFSATTAVVLHHSEAYSVSLDVDSFKGNLRGELLRMTVIMQQASSLSS